MTTKKRTTKTSARTKPAAAKASAGEDRSASTSETTTTGVLGLNLMDQTYERVSGLQHAVLGAMAPLVPSRAEASEIPEGAEPTPVTRVRGTLDGVSLKGITMPGAGKALVDDVLGLLKR